MKNIVRALALALVATGALASGHNTTNAAKTTLSARASALPIPMCAPGSPDGNAGCGVCQLTGRCIQ